MNLTGTSSETCEVITSTEPSSHKHHHALGTPPIASFGPSPPITNPAFQLKDWKEFACGWGAAFINVTVTFPINKVMFRQMLHGVKTKSAVKQLYTEGFFYLYRGILPPLCQKTASVSIMFGCYEDYQKRVPHEIRESYPKVTKAVAAILAGCTEAILSPFERIQTLMQAASLGPDAFAAASLRYRRCVDYLSSGSYPSIYLAWVALPGANKIAPASTALGVIRTHKPFHHDKVVVLGEGMQDKSYHGRFVNTAHAFREVASQHGAREFYRGIVPILLRNGPSNAAFFILREEAQKPGVLFWISSPNSSPAARILADFCSGALIGAFISTVFYPLNVVKTHMQIRLGGPFVTLREVFSEIYNERGSWRKMYRGVHVNYTRALITWGVINVSYEALKKIFT